MDRASRGLKRRTVSNWIGCGKNFGRIVINLSRFDEKRSRRAGRPGEFRTLGIPTVYGRACQQALLQRLEPISEPVFDEANFGYRRGRSAKDALTKVWKEIEGGSAWIVDADLKDFFGSVDHEKLLTLAAQRVADRRVLRLIKSMLKAGSYGEGRLFPTERGNPQGGVVSPLLANLFLQYAFDRWMAKHQAKFPFERFADDAIVHCRTEKEAEEVGGAIAERLRECGLELHPEKTRIVYCKYDDRRGTYAHEKFDFPGYTFRPGRSKNRAGKFLINFSPAVHFEIQRSLWAWRNFIILNACLSNSKEVYRPLRSLRQNWEAPTTRDFRNRHLVPYK